MGGMKSKKPGRNLPAVINRIEKSSEVEQRISKLLPLVRTLQVYHRHQVVGLRNLPTSGPYLLVTNHSLATYDILLLFAAIYQNSRRLVRPLVDRAFWKFPFLGDIMNHFGSVQGNNDSAKELLAGGNIVAVAPGGMLEALRPSDERYQVRWRKRRGFARLAMECQVPVVLAACPRADDLYEIYPNPLTKFIYEKLRLPLPVARGLGLTIIPRPVKLVHYVSEAMRPPKLDKDPEVNEKRLEAFHQKLTRRMQQLIGEAIAHESHE
jgi:1-acyl-sn-glycerol-3-phosphate acyltransferase